ncbi:MAG: glycosyltransferase family 39 protein [Parcubacteria group bacterium]
MKNFFQNKKIILFLLLALAIYFSFGTYHIGKFVTVDEAHWLYTRIPQYWKGVLNQKWALTYIHEKPGVTLAIISGTGLLQYNDPAKDIEKIKPDITGNTQAIEKFLSTFRLPLVIFNGIFSLFFFWIIRKITENQWVALWSAILILLSPILIGMSQIVNSDALLWVFSTAAILSFAGFLKTEEKKLAAFSALFLGLSVLTKFTSVILMPFLFIMAVFYYLEKIEEWTKNKIDVSKKILNATLAYLTAIFGSLLVFAVLMPASFLKPEYLYKGTIGYPGIQFILWPILALQLLIVLDHFVWKNKITISMLNITQKYWNRYAKIIYAMLSFAFLLLLANYALGRDFLRFESVPFDSYQEWIFYSQPWIQKMLLEFRPLVFSVTPLVLFSILYLWIKSFQKTVEENFLVLTISIFLIIFCAAVIQEKLLNIIRYSIILYPLLAILAAIGIYEFFELKKLQKINKNWITLGIILASALSLWQIKPFYLNYTSDLLPKKYIITDAWGYGGYEAAQFLNARAEAKKTPVWSDSSGFCEFYTGPCVKGKCDWPDGFSSFSYFKLDRRGQLLFKEKESRDKYCKKNPQLFREISGQYDRTDTIFDLAIDNRPGNSIRIVPAE